MLEIRFAQDTNTLIYQLYRSFCNAFAGASDVLLHLGGGPRIAGTFAYKLNPTADLGPFPIGKEGELYFNADLSRDAPSDILPELLVNAMRQAGELSDCDEFTEGLQRFWQEHYLQPRGGIDLRAEWTK